MAEIVRRTEAVVVSSEFCLMCGCICGEVSLLTSLVVGEDSKSGKIMEKLGGMMGNEKMQQKGYEKREQAGYGSGGGDSSEY